MSPQLDPRALSSLAPSLAHVCAVCRKMRSGWMNFTFKFKIDEFTVSVSELTVSSQ